MNCDDLLRGAEKVISVCLDLQRGESLAVLVDTPNRNVGLVLCEAGRAAGADVSFLVMDPREAHAVDPPRPICEAIRHVDAAVLATTYSLSNSQARRKANQAGTRVVSLPGCCEDLLTGGAIDADFAAHRPTIEKLGRFLSVSKSMHITSQAGTDVMVKLGGHKSVDQFAMAHAPGSWTPAPNIETAIAPQLDGVDGEFIADGALVPGGVPEQPVCIEFQKGKLVSIVGGEDADRFRRMLEAFNDDNMYQVVEIGIGLNPKARIGRGLMIEDECKYGTMHFGLGEGRTFGIEVVAPSHVDLVMLMPTINVDGKVILQNEQLDPSFTQ